MVITIPKELTNRDADYDKLQAERNGYKARLDEVERELRKCESIIAAGEEEQVSDVKAKVLAWMGRVVAPDSPEMARKRRDELYVERKKLRAALAIVDRELESKHNLVCIELCEELKPQFAAAYRAWIESLIASARLAQPIINAHRELAERGVFAFIPQMVYGTGHAGYGKHDLGCRESEICHLIREAVRLGYVARNDPILNGVNYK